jgi:hypothetical protein
METFGYGNFPVGVTEATIARHFGGCDDDEIVDCAHCRDCGVMFIDADLSKCACGCDEMVCAGCAQIHKAEADHAE